MLQLLPFNIIWGVGKEQRYGFAFESSNVFCYKLTKFVENRRILLPRQQNALRLSAFCYPRPVLQTCCNCKEFYWPSCFHLFRILAKIDTNAYGINQIRHPPLISEKRYILHPSPAPLPYNFFPLLLLWVRPHFVTPNAFLPVKNIYCSCYLLILMGCGVRTAVWNRI